MSFQFTSELQRITINQEKLFRKEYEEVYEVQCRERGTAALQYAAWRHNRLNADLGNVDRINGDQTSLTA